STWPSTLPRCSCVAGMSPSAEVGPPPALGLVLDVSPAGSVGSATSADGSEAASAGSAGLSFLQPASPNPAKMAIAAARGAALRETADDPKMLEWRESCS